MMQSTLLLSAALFIGSMGMFRDADNAQTTPMHADPQAACLVDPAQGEVLAFKTAPLPEEMQVMLRAAYPLLKQEKDFSDQFTIAVQDVNNDGKQDYFVQHANGFYCGSGGCNVDVMIKNPKVGYTQAYAFFKGSGYAVLLPEIRNNMRSLLVKISDVDATYTKHEWDGKQYQEIATCDF